MAVVLLAAVLFALGLPHSATGHGYLEQPVARNVLSYRAGQQYDPQSLSSGGEKNLPEEGGEWAWFGGSWMQQHSFCRCDASSHNPRCEQFSLPSSAAAHCASCHPARSHSNLNHHALWPAGVAVVSAGGAIWPAGQRSMCGDPTTLAEPRPHEAGGAFWTGAVAPASVFTEGQVVNLTLRLTANHMGRFTFRVCRVVGTDVAAERAQLTDACLDEHILLQANSPDAQVRTLDEAFQAGWRASGVAGALSGNMCPAYKTWHALSWHHPSPPQSPGQRFWYVSGSQFLFNMPYQLPQVDKAKGG